MRPPAKEKEKKGPPTADEIPDIAHEISMMEAEGKDDPSYLFALAYVKTKSPSVAYQIAFGLPEIDADIDIEERVREGAKRFVLGNALLNSADVQVALAEFYHRLGARLHITPESMIARVWLTINDPMTSDKEIPKLMDTLLKIQNPGNRGDDESKAGASAPTVHVHISAPGAPAPSTTRLSMAGHASTPLIDVSVSPSPEETVDLPLIDEA